MFQHIRALNLIARDARVKNLNTDVLFVLNDIPLIDPNTSKINTLLLPDFKVESGRYTNFGKYTKRDISAGYICLVVDEDGERVTLYKDDKVFKTVTKTNNKLTDVCIKHKMGNGLYYTLTNTENLILEVDAKLASDWSSDMVSRKYILTKPNKPKK